MKASMNLSDTCDMMEWNVWTKWAKHKIINYLYNGIMKNWGGKGGCHRWCMVC